jgi:hypothetical protein
MSVDTQALRYPFLCPQCGCPTHGSATSGGQRSTFCDDCVGDREIDDQPFDNLASRK